MMIFTIIAKESGIFQYFALKVIKYSRGNSLLILSIVFIASFFSHIINLNLATIYLSGVIILLIISQDRPDEIYAQIDWRVIFFLIGLNILTGALVENGLIEIISSKLLSFSGEN